MTVLNILVQQKKIVTIKNYLAGCEIFCDVQEGN